MRPSSTTSTRSDAHDRREPVRDDDRRAVGEQRLQPHLHERLPRDVQRAGRLVQDQQRRVGQERARERHQLALPGRQPDAALVGLGVVPVGHPRDEVVHADRARGRLDLLGRRSGLAERDVGTERAGEQVRLLRDHHDGPPQVDRVDLAHVEPVQADGALADVVEPGEQLGDRRLAGTRLSDERRSTGRPGCAGRRAAGPSGRCRTRTRRRRTGRPRGRARAAAGATGSGTVGSSASNAASFSRAAVADWKEL